MKKDMKKSDFEAYDSFLYSPVLSFSDVCIGIMVEEKMLCYTNDLLI